MFWCLLPLWQCECGHLLCSEHSFQPSANPTQSRTQFQITRGRKDFQNCLNISLTHRLLIAVCQVSTLHKSKFPPERGKTEQILIFIKRKKKKPKPSQNEIKISFPKTFLQLWYLCSFEMSEWGIRNFLTICELQVGQKFETTHTKQTLMYTKYIDTYGHTCKFLSVFWINSYSD